MLHNWLQPLSPLSTPYPDDCLGSTIQRYEGTIPTLKKGTIAIMGLGNEQADVIRQSLYALKSPFDGVTITDLGNARKQESIFLIPLIKELLESEVMPILIGSQPVQALAQYKAYQELQYLINLVVVDEQVPYHSATRNTNVYFLQEIIDSPRSSLFHLSFIGGQAHYVGPATLQALTKRHFDYVRLGKARADLPDLEPIIRDGDLLSFNLSAIKGMEALGQVRPSPNGFSSDEACQIARYAGMSDKLKSFGIYGFEPKMDFMEQTAQLVAQMIWYFIDGYHQRKGDFPATMEGLAEYIVDFKDHDYQITFWRSERSSRWWMQVPVKTHHQLQRHRLVPCSYNDYLEACQGKLPERLLQALERFN
jgi:formiminoglutamase